MKALTEIFRVQVNVKATKYKRTTVKHLKLFNSLKSLIVLKYSNIELCLPTLPPIKIKKCITYIVTYAFTKLQDKFN